jgi:NAD(P)-dependent dehydrogenase (short-subunit alcohol dehydrogenase family)
MGPPDVGRCQPVDTSVQWRGLAGAVADDTFEESEEEKAEGFVFEQASAGAVPRSPCRAVALLVSICCRLYPATSRCGSIACGTTRIPGEVPVEGLADKVVLVTGGSSGIGEACARRLAAEGCAVMVAGRDEAKTRAVAGSLLPEGRHGWVTGDVREVGECRALVTATMERYGQLDVLVHCVGVWDARPTLDVSEEDWDAVLDTCLKGAFFTMQAALAPMVEAGGGVIVVIASDSGHHSEPGAVAYAAAKAGLINVVRTLAHDHGPDGVRVVAISPGMIETPMLAGAFAEACDAEAFAAVQAEGYPADGYPVGRVGRPAEIAAVVAFVASDEATFVTGDSWLVDGGYCA